MRLRNLAIPLLAIALLPVLAHGDEWHRSFAVSGQPTLRVDANDGSLQISSWDRPQIDARVVTRGWTIGADGVTVTATQNGNEVILVVRRLRHSWVWNLGNRWVHVELTVPRRLALDARTGDGDVRLASVAGSLRVHTGDGDIAGQNLDAGQFEGTTGDGDVRVTGRFDDLNVRSGDGDLVVEAATGSQIAAPWSLRSGDGDITLALPEGFKADLDARTGDGAITLDYPVTVSGQVGHSTVRGEVNGGGGELAVHTGDGNIHLTR